MLSNGVFSLSKHTYHEKQHIKIHHKEISHQNQQRGIAP